MSQFRYSIEQKVFMYEAYLLTHSAREVIKQFRKRFSGGCGPPGGPYRTTIYTLIKKFRETGNLNDKKGKPSKSVLTKEKLDDIASRLVNTPDKSLRILAKETGLCYSSARRAMKILKLKSCMETQELRLAVSDCDISVIDAVQDMDTGRAATYEVNWKTVDLFSKSIPDHINKEDVKSEVGVINIQDVSMFYRKTTPPVRVQASGQSLLLLHGKNFKSETWEKLGTMNLMAALGHLVVAVDLPGYGETEQTYRGDYSKFIATIVKSKLLSDTRPVLISPSMSGEYSVKFVGEHADLLSGYIPIAPVATSSVPQETLKNAKVPTLIVYGDKDETPMAKQAPKDLNIMPNSREVRLKDARHAAYLDQPDLFHKMLYNFMELLHV